MQTKTVYKRCTALVLVLALCALLTLPVLAEGADDTVHIGSASDLRQLAKNCSLDTWSVGKTVSLDVDIDLGGDYVLIPTFGGTFEGNGHTISGYKLTKELAPAGLFGWVQAGGQVQNLNVEGELAPEGDRVIVGGIAGRNYGVIAACSFSGTIEGLKQAGGIAGINEEGGVISGCTSEGTVSARSAVGGIVGENNGAVNACTNGSDVNNTLQPTESDDTLSRISNTFKSLVDNGIIDTEDLTVDVGGIAGYSSGAINGCTNNGDVGYNYVGYNVGGVAGRSDGLIIQSTNHGFIQGNKDVGGIAGQAEPDLELNLSEGTLQQLSDELDKLQSLVDSTADIADAHSDKLHDNMTKLSDYLNQASQSATDMHGQVVDWADQTADEAQRVADVLDESIDRVKKIKDDAQPAIDNLDGTFDRLESCLYQLAIESGIAAFATGTLTAASYSASKATSGMNDSLGLLQSGAKLMVPSYSADMSTVQKATTVAGQLTGLATVISGLIKLDSVLNVASGTTYTTAEMTNIIASLMQQGYTQDQAYQTAVAYQKLFGSAGMTTAQATTLAEALSGAGSALSGSANTLGVLNTLVSGLTSASGAAGAANLASSLSSMIGGLSDLQSAFRRSTISLGALTVDTALMGLTFAQLGGIMGDVAKSIDMAQPAIDEAKDLVDYLADQPGVTIPRLNDSVHDDGDTLISSFAGVTEQVAALSENAYDMEGDISDKVRDISDQTSVVTDLLIDALKKASDPDAENYFNDISSQEADENAPGQILSSENDGKIKGNTNVGGVAGSQSIESLLDPDDDLSELSLGGLNGVYDSRAVLRGCTNNGRVIARKGSAGGIAGLASLGLIDSCYGYGIISGIDGEGEAIGGIAGMCSAEVRDSWAKCFLSGETYVGGIVGRGEENDILGEKCTVTNCRSIVQIANAVQYYGAVAGESTGEYSGNTFVSDELSGIDYRSVAGAAEPVTYEAMQQLEDLPDEFRTLKLVFMADDEVVKEVTFASGASFDENSFPAVANEDGSYVSWDKTDLSNLTSDTMVTGEHIAYVTTLASTESRDDGRTVFYVEGSFKEGDAIACQSEEVAAEAEELLPENSRGSGKQPAEQWVITFPEDGAAAHTVRYLPAEGSAAKVVAYQHTDAGWVELETKAAGSYAAFEVEGDSAELLLSTKSTWFELWMLLPLCGITAVLCVGGVWVHKHKKKNKVKVGDPNP